ncbi:MAG: RsmD family RNA methyltransferase [Paludibacteraceae bacterium]|jgi:16S rRNA (guanine(966)-N(2))-methyltransferase RsmD|nr:RsmD family RNA methyltransferase [Paludibacteraceae bacterium]
MRIISGKFRGRRLMPPKNITARPTTDFAKESLFNLLTNRLELEGADVLDLFAGTGGIGLECVSRGAREVTAVELAHVQQNFIISTCKQLGITNLRLIRGDVFKFLRNNCPKYDLVFADPPYALDELPTLPSLIVPELLKPGGLFVLEHGEQYDFSGHPHFIDLRTYGSVHFSFFQ